MRNTGATLLTLGFAMLALSALIRDPIALDANIGAGALTLVGLPVGALGIAVLLISAVISLVARRALRRQT